MEGFKERVLLIFMSLFERQSIRQREGGRKRRGREEGKRKREILRLLVHSSNSCNHPRAEPSWGHGRHSIQESLVGGRDQTTWTIFRCLCRHISKEVRLEVKQPELELALWLAMPLSPSNSLNYCATMPDAKKKKKKSTSVSGFLLKYLWKTI